MTLEEIQKRFNNPELGRGTSLYVGIVTIFVGLVRILVCVDSRYRDGVDTGELEWMVNIQPGGGTYVTPERWTEYLESVAEAEKVRKELESLGIATGLEAPASERDVRS